MSKSIKGPKKVYTKNEWIAGRHAFLSWALRKIADHCKKHEHDPGQIIEYMREIADEHEAQEMVVKLRDELLKNGK